MSASATSPSAEHSFSVKVTAFGLYALVCAVVAGLTFGVFAGVTIATARAIVQVLS